MNITSKAFISVSICTNLLHSDFSSYFLSPDESKISFTTSNSNVYVSNTIYTLSTNEVLELFLDFLQEKYDEFISKLKRSKSTVNILFYLKNTDENIIVIEFSPKMISFCVDMNASLSFTTEK